MTVIRKYGDYMGGKRYDPIPGGLVSETVVTTNDKKSAEVVVVKKFPLKGA